MAGALGALAHASRTLPVCYLRDCPKFRLCSAGRVLGLGLIPARTARGVISPEEPCVPVQLPTSRRLVDAPAVASVAASGCVWVLAFYF